LLSRTDPATDLRFFENAPSKVGAFFIGHQTGGGVSRRDKRLVSGLKSENQALE